MASMGMTRGGHGNTVRWARRMGEEWGGGRPPEVSTPTLSVGRTVSLKRQRGQAQQHVSIVLIVGDLEEGRRRQGALGLRCVGPQLA